MRIIKIFFPILAVALFYSCFSDRNWDNPYDPESNIEFIKPEITSIQTIDFNQVEINWLKKDTLYTIVKLERATTNNTGAFTVVSELNADAGTGVDSGVVFGQEYFYRILGLADEVEGEYSDIASAMVTIPAPTNLSAESLNDQAVKLTWDEPGSTQAGRGETSGPQGKKQIVIEKKYKSQGPIAGEDLENDGLKRTAEAEVTTNDKPNKKESAEKKQIPGTPGYEQKPGGTSNGQRGLGRTFAGESFIDGYVIERAEGNGSFSVVDSVSNTDQYNDSGLLFGQTYKYRVCAYADQYKSDYVTLGSVSTIFPTPSNLTAIATSDQSIALSWSDNCSFEDGYELWRKVGSGSYSIIDSTEANGTAYADSGLTYGETYTYKIRAFTSLNVSNYSGEESTVMSIPAPSGLTILQGDDTAIINWTDNSSFETGFSIEKSVEAAPFSEIGTVASNAVTYTDTDVDAISQYRYRVRAFTESNYSDYSEEAEFSLFTGDIYYISPTGSDFTGNGSANYPYKTIQKGIDVAGDSSLILVANGTYNESIDYSGKELTVASYYWLDIDTSHISATTISAVEGRVVNLDTDDSELLGFTVTSGDASQGSGIYASDSVTIANCIITGNSYAGAGTGGGIYCAIFSEVTISNCTITGNSITADDSEGAGVYCGSSSTVNFTDCTITGNTITGDESHGAGIYASASSELSLISCVVNENAIVGDQIAGAGVFSLGATLEVSGCDISGNTVTSENPEGGMGFGAINFTFTNCGQTGREGPSQSQVNSAYTGTALAGQVTSNYGIQEWTVPYGGSYTIEVWGARGGTQTEYNYGGRGARMRGDFELVGGVTLQIAVGQKGVDSNCGDCDGGGGGGTFVAQGSSVSSAMPLIIAGGGGGDGSDSNGGDATLDENAPSNSNTGYGGGDWGGGGFYGSASGSSGGQGFQQGATGGDGWFDGGFGGGGGSANEYASGGGGYTGGYASDIWSTGGAGSYNDGSNQDNASGVNTDHGQVVITMIHSATQGVGIYASADLTIDNSTINNNEIIIPGNRGGPYGGGVFATGSLTMTGSETSNNGADGVYCTSSGASYTNITASGNGSYGIYSGGSASFTNITANSNGANGLYDEDGTSTFDNCTANSNTGDGIYTAGNGTFSDCTANNNASGRGIWCDGAGSFTTCETNNNFNDGIYASDGSDFNGCNAGGNGGDGLYAGGNSTFSGCTATGNGGGGMLATGTGDFTACVSTGNTGGYGLYCGNAGTFFGCTSGSNGSKGISAGSGISTVDGCDVTNNGGAGVSIVGSGTFNSLTITGNAGTGISVGSGTSTFTDITVSNSSSGRGIYNAGTGEFVNVTVSGSSSDGIYTGASTSLNNCSSSSNGGYGIWVDNSGFLTNCLADGNDKGIYVGAYSSEIINCLATNNTTYGMELLNSSTLIQNCAISDNGTGVFAGGTSGPAFMNVIIYDNTTELDGESGSTYTIDYSDIKGGSTFGAWATGSGNIDADPLFVGSGDYNLQNSSPCINTGNPGVQYNDTDGSRNDMGAYGGPNGDW